MRRGAEAVVFALWFAGACGRVGFDAVVGDDAGSEPLQQPTFGEPVRVDVELASDTAPAIGWTQDGFTIAWTDVGDPSVLVACKVSVEGEPMVSPRAIANSSMGQKIVWPTIDSAGSSHALGLARSEGELWLVPLNAQVEAIAIPRTLGITAEVSPPDVAVGHAQYALSWAGAVGVTLGLVPVDLGTDIDVKINARSSAQSASVVATTEGFVVVWSDARNESRELYGVEVSPDGTIGDEFIITSDGRPSSGPRTALSSRTRMGVAWSDYDGGLSPETLYFAQIDLPSYEVAEPLIISDDTGAPPNLGLAASSTELMLAWEDGDANAVVVTAIRGEAFLSTVASQVGRPATQPALDRGEGIYGLVWLENTVAGYEVYYRWVRLAP